MEKFIIRFRVLIFVLIGICILLSAWHVLNGNIFFHTDIARDFLVLEDIVKTHKPTLLGPRSGGISGVFHGPLWFYINLPAFIIGKGNPVVVGWFWVLLSVLSIWITYYWGKRLFDKKIGLISALLFSVILIPYAKNLFNPFGAVMLFPIFFYLFQKYLKSVKTRHLILSLFILGLIIQFQIAFGVPILILTTMYLIYFLIKKKKLYHMFSYLILIIPLSTYFLFELRHDFLQTRSVISYILTKHGIGQLSLPEIVQSRIKGAFLDGLMIVPYSKWFTLPITILFGYILYKFKKGNLKYKDTYFLFFYFYFGYWIITLAFKGTVWGYYYWPFLPLIVFVFCSTIEFINKKIFIALFLYVLILNFYYGLQTIKPADSEWKFYHNLAEDIYKNAKKSEFGYYIYTPDQYAYSGKYAMNYTQHEFENTKSYPYTKKKLTYLIIAPAPKDKPWLNGEWWTSHQVNINRKVDSLMNYPNGVVVYKYILSDKEIKITSDPNLIQTLIFR